MNSERHRIVDKAAAVLHGQGRRALRRWRRLRRREHGGFHRLPGGRKRRGVLAGGALRSRNGHDQKRCDARRNRHRDRETDDLLEHSAPPRQLAEHGGRFDRRSFPRLLHGLGDGLVEHVVLAAGLAEWLQGRSFRRQSRTPLLGLNGRRARLLVAPVPVRAARNTPGHSGPRFPSRFELLILNTRPDEANPPASRTYADCARCDPRNCCRAQPRPCGSAPATEPELRSSCSASG